MAHLFPPFLLQSRPAWPLLHPVCLLAASYKLGPKRKLNPNSVPGSTLLVVWGSWIAQGYWLDPKSIASRIVFLVSFLCGVLIYTAYSAKVISFLSVTKATLPFSNMR